MWDALNLPPQDMALLIAICFAAGVVRGFSGFALSALVMAAGTIILPPVALIPICWWLEMAASVLMLRGGFKDANKPVVFLLAGASAIGVPLGLWATMSISLEASKTIALVLVAVLAATQLAKIRLPFLATKSGTATAGLCAGIVTGLASIGGMVIALFVLAQNTQAREMRANLVLFLFLGAVTSLVSYSLSGIMDRDAIIRGLALAVPTLAGVWIGKTFFTPKYEPYYKPFCLTLLIGLAAAGLIRMGVSR
ncbi:sulfite exporter TauE/SafE family protein [Algirhabdus cladophorae]|uniref:sulfite exporter TauE/SafE family protein n=1 Tax=Algirhabdus cladophorae TaxID=3377108 RepID=UPI003B846A14